MDKDYKYTTKFTSVVKATNDYEKKFSISKANLEEIAAFMPPNVDLEKNIDLLGVSFNVAVVNQFNGNGDGISCSLAKQIFPYFANKPTNLEHFNEEIVGHIVGSRLTSVDGEYMTENELEGFEDPFYITLAAVVYKTVKPEFAKYLLQSSDESSDLFGSIASSWELGFSNYSIAITNGSNNFKDSNLITDASEIEKLSPYLKAFGGDGKAPNGMSVFRVIEGPIYPLGAAFTTNPAANVNGIFTFKNNSLVVKDTKKFMVDNNFAKNKEKEWVKISQNSTTAVNKENNIENMDTEQLKKEIEGVIDSKLSGLVEKSNASSISQVIAEAIKDKDAEFKKEREIVEQAKARAEQEAVEYKNSVDTLKSELSEAQQKITELTTTIETAQASELFSTRMAKIDDIYDLNDDYRSVLSNEIKSLDKSEASFESYLSKLEVTLAHKNKEFIDRQEKTRQEAIDKAVEEKLKQLNVSSASSKDDEDAEGNKIDPNKVIDKAKANDDTRVPNNSSATSDGQKKSLVEELTEKFNVKEIKIKY